MKIWTPPPAAVTPPAFVSLALQSDVARDSTNFRVSLSHFFYLHLISLLPVFIPSNSPQFIKMSRTETYTLAHTARCKLQMAADRPDRNLRFILGHAFTLDNLRLRIAEIETDTSAYISDSDEDEDLPTCNANVVPVGKPRKVSFGSSPRPTNVGGVGGRPKSPPPDELAQLSSSESEEEEDDIEEDDEFEEEGLGLTRFESATAKAPRMVPDEEDDEEDDIGPKSPELLPSEGDLKLIIGQEGDEELQQAYTQIGRCPCHASHGPAVEKVWELKGQTGEHGGRMAVVQVGA